MNAFLKMKKLSDVVENPIPAMRNEDWNNRNDSAVFHLMDKLSNQMMNNIRGARSARIMLKKLDKIYSKKNMSEVI